MPRRYPSPPGLALVILRWSTASCGSEAVVGDLVERFNHRVTHGIGAPRLWFWGQTLLFAGYFLAAWLRAPIGGARVGLSSRSPALDSPVEGGARQAAKEDRMDSFLTDLKLTARQVVRQPVLTLTIIVTLALGIGANTAIFSVVNGVLLRPLPYAEPEELVLFRADLWGINRNPGIALAEVNDFREQGRLIEDVGAVTRQGSTVLTDGEATESVSSAGVTSNLFGLLGVEPFMGRWFTLDEGDPDATGNPVVISHGLWQRRYGSDPGILGRTIGESFNVVGVTEPGFGIHLESATGVGSSIDLWNVLRFFDARNFWGYRAIGRLADGVSLEQAQAEVTAVSHAFIEQHPETYIDGEMDMSVSISPLHGDLVQNVRSSILIVLGAVAMVLLIACINTAGLLLARTKSRESELAIRAAMGAGRGRIIRQVLTESLALALIGGLLGLGLGVVGVKAMLALQPGDLPRIDDIGLDRSVLAFTVLVSLAASAASGLLPALKASRPNLQDTLKGGERGLGLGSRNRLQSLLVVFEVAFSLMLLIGTGLMVRTFVSLQDAELGFDPAGVLTMEVPIPFRQFREPHERLAFYQSLTRRVGSLPGVEAVGAVSEIHLGPRLAIRGPYGDPERPETLGRISAGHRRVLPGFFEAMGIELRAGRTFEPRDMEGLQALAVVDERVAESTWPGDDAIGKTLQIGLTTRLDTLHVRVIGVVASTVNTGVRDPGLPQIYLPYPSVADARLSLVVRGGGEVAGLTPTIRTHVEELGSNWSVRAVKTMERYVGEATAGERFTLVLMTAMGGLALLLASIGIYGVIAYLVSRRTRETGIRLALGAQRSTILRANLGEGLNLVLLGVPLGLLGAWGLSRFLETLLFGVTPTDPLTYGTISALLLLVGLVASYTPAHRAAHVDPVVALRAD